MIELNSKESIFLDWEHENEPIILPVTSNTELPNVLAKKYALLVGDENFGKLDRAEVESFGTVLFKDRKFVRDVKKSIVLDKSINHIDDGDVLRINPFAKQVKILYRKKSDHNGLLVTERCNSYCLMCSQPPRNVDDSYLIDEVCKTISLIPRGCESLGITGGEPTLLKNDFIKIVRYAKNFLPETRLHILTNGRAFSDLSFAKKLFDVAHPNLTLGIPLYSDQPDIHDFVVQSQGAYDETIKGIVNLKSFDINIEIRSVIHKQTYKRLPDLARFIARNLAFVQHVAFMGLELTGFTKANFSALWIDPYEYRNELEEAIRNLSLSGVPALIYNHQLCLIPESIRDHSVKSISDWKNDYLDVCNECLIKNDCGGFFDTGLGLECHSEHIRPVIRETNHIPIYEVFND